MTVRRRCALAELYILSVRVDARAAACRSGYMLITRAAGRIWSAHRKKPRPVCVCTCMYRFVRVHVLERCISRRRWRQSFTIASARSEVIGNEEPPIDFTSLGPKFDWDSRFCARSPPASLFLISLRRLCRFFLFFLSCPEGERERIPADDTRQRWPAKCARARV